MGSNTPNHSFYQPSSGETGWGTAKNGDWGDLDSRLVIKDTLANRPAAGTAGRWFLATDTGHLSYDNGTAWERISGLDTEDSGTGVAANTTGVNFGQNLTVTDDTDGTVTVAASTGSGTTYATTTQTSAYTANNADFVLADSSAGSFTVTLPAPAADVIVAVKKISGSGNTVTIGRSGTESIDGNANDVTLTNENDEIEVISDGTDWFIY